MGFQIDFQTTEIIEISAFAWHWHWIEKSGLWNGFDDNS